VEPLRIGVLGAARISELSIIGPAAATGTRLVAVAARNRDRAETFARTHGIERVHESYADVIADPEVEAIYNPLANSLHAPWNKAAILAGKHVLTEKPFASNSREAAQVRDLARGSSLVLFEGFHYLYHPLMERLMSLLADGELGALRRVESTMFMSAPPADDPRWSLALAGGALMDLGCYALHAQRVLGDFAGGEPRLVGARGAERAGVPSNSLPARPVSPGAA
jgi:predicted dehydrogenase